MSKKNSQITWRIAVTLFLGTSAMATHLLLLMNEHVFSRSQDIPAEFGDMLNATPYIFGPLCALAIVTALVGALGGIKKDSEEAAEAEK